MRVTYMRLSTLRGSALYALLRDDHLELQVEVPDMSQQALADLAFGLRVQAQSLLERAAFIEQASVVPADIGGPDCGA